MTLTKNNIAYVRENHFQSGKVIWAVMPKNHNMCDARFYEVESVDNLPKIVQKFISDRKCEMLENNERFGYTVYIYR